MNEDAQFHVIFWDDSSGTYQHLIDGLRQREIPVHLISDIIPDKDEAPEQYALRLDGHPSPLAHQRIAEYVATRILVSPEEQGDELER